MNDAYLKEIRAQDITYHGKSLFHEFGLYASRFNGITGGDPAYNTVDLVGRDGSLYQSKKKNDDSSLSITLLGLDVKDWREMLTRIRHWVYGSGEERLYESSRPGYFWKVKNATVEPIDQVNYSAFQAKIKFTVDPHEYRQDGLSPISEEPVPCFLVDDDGVAVEDSGALIDAEDYLYESALVLADDDGIAVLDDADSKAIGTGTHAIHLYNYHDTAHPTYMIDGAYDGYIFVNDKYVRLTQPDGLVIDTDRMVAYNALGCISRTLVDDGKAYYIYATHDDALMQESRFEPSGYARMRLNPSLKWELRNSNISGEYDDLYLPHGDNRVEITDNINLIVVPNWREY